MFIQVIQGKIKDEAAMRRAMDRWERDLMPGATGYLGTTAGRSDDGTFIALVRFESEELAARNSQRPEQGTWWQEEMEPCYDGPITFLNCPDVQQWLDGGSDGAGFVQIMEGHSRDVARMHQLMMQAGGRIHEMRPEIIGGLMCGSGDGGYVDAIYFTSEAEARMHEKMEVPDDIRSLFEEEAALMGDVAYFDLREPMLVSARR